MAKHAHRGMPHAVEWIRSQNIRCTVLSNAESMVADYNRPENADWMINECDD